MQTNGPLHGLSPHSGLSNVHEITGVLQTLHDVAAVDIFNLQGS